MVAEVKTIAFKGIDAIDVTLQLVISSGLPAFHIVGLPDKAVGESRERVRAAINALGLSIPNKRITVNLAPADIVKEGSHYDLPLALGLLCAMDVVNQEILNDFYVMGELGLDSRLTPVAGVLLASIHANKYEKGLICPQDCGSEAYLSGLKNIIAIDSLHLLLQYFQGGIPAPTIQKPVYNIQNSKNDFAHVKGQETAKRALEICAAGGHNLLLCGPPGAGKSLLASCLPSIMPPMTPQEALDVTLIHSLSGAFINAPISQQRPYRSPHHTSSTVAMSGGGNRAMPGEISLAHHGVLFLDELPEFSRATLEVLRQPLESNNISIARANHHVTYPADIQLIAAMNPCRCGYLGNDSHACHRAPKCGLDYQSKISGPLLDRFDLYLDIQAVSAHDLITKDNDSESSATIRQRVIASRTFQQQRMETGDDNIKPNARLTNEELENYVQLDEDAKDIMKTAIDNLQLTARGYYRILRVARTIADLAYHHHIQTYDVLEAISYRQLPRNT